MRLNKKWITYGVVIGLVAAFATLGIVQAQQMAKKNSLSDELDTAERNLSVLEAAQSSSQNGTDTNEDATSYSVARAQLSQSIDSIIASESLFSVADASSVTLTSMTLSPFSDSVLAQLPCSYLPIQITAEGNETTLFDFISRLNTDLTNGLVRSAILNVPDTPAEGEATADIGLIIYIYQGE